MSFCNGINRAHRSALPQIAAIHDFSSSLDSTALILLAPPLRLDGILDMLHSKMHENLINIGTNIAMCPRQVESLTLFQAEPMVTKHVRDYRVGIVVDRTTQ